MEYKELLEQYGFDYCVDKRGEYELYDMDELEEIALNDRSSIDVFEMALYAYAWQPSKDDWEGHTEDFHMNDEYFAFDAYNHLCSVPDIWCAKWYDVHIDAEYFIEWLVDNEYIASADEITYNEEI